MSAVYFAGRHANPHGERTQGKRREEQWSLRGHTVFPMSPCVPSGHVFEPVPDDISSRTDSRKQLLDRIWSDCF